MDETKIVVGYIDGTDWLYEIEENPEGVRIYPDVSSIQEKRKCIEECGIVEVEVRIRRIVCGPKI